MRLLMYNTQLKHESLAMWTPSLPSVETLSALFVTSVDGSREKRAARIEARRQLEAARSEPDLVNYLVFMLVEYDSSESVKATAGLWLKNVLIFDWSKLTPAAVEYVKSNILRGLQSDVPLIRNTSSIVITTLLSKAGLSGWPELLPELVSAIDQSEAGSPLQDGCLSALRKICEDSASLVAKDHNLMVQLVPKLISFCGSQSPKVRSNAVGCLTEFVPLGCDEFLVHIDEFLQACFTLAQNDTTPDTLFSICRAFNELLTCRPDTLVPYLRGVVEFCVHCTRSPEESVSLEGAEVLLTLAQSDADEETLDPLMPLILPQILDNMVLNEEDLFVLESMAEDDSAEADRDQDIKPNAIKSKKTRAQGSQDEDSDDEDDFEAGLENWNLRKCSASALDRIALKNAPLTVQIALPILLQKIAPDQTWPIRESAVLAFGAIAQGCLESGETSFVPELVSFLCDLLGNEHAPIRDISCWTLSRYTGQEGIDWKAFEGVLRCTVDVNKRVQASACAALATLAENAGSELDNYAADLFQHLRLCFSKYQAKNVFALYECIQTVALACTQAVQENPAIVNPVIEPMLARWNSLSEDDRELLAILECFSYLAIAMGTGFAEFAPPLFERSILMIREILVLLERAKVDPIGVESPDPAIITCSLDMVDGLVQALQSEGMAPLFAAQEQSTQTTILEMIRMCLDLDIYDVSQSALAVAGDLAIYCFDTQLLPYLPQFIPELIKLIDPESIKDNMLYEPVGDNAMWVIAEISLHYEKFSLKPYFNDLLQRLGTVLCSPDVQSAPLLSNAATAIGRISIGLPELVGPHLPAFIAKWLSVVVDLEPSYEKDTALQGICMAITTNPSALNDELLVGFFKVLASYFTPSPDLVNLVRSLVDVYKQALPNFEATVANIPPMFRQQLSAQYNV